MARRWRETLALGLRRAFLCIFHHRQEPQFRGVVSASGTAIPGESFAPIVSAPISNITRGWLNSAGLTLNETCSVYNNSHELRSPITLPGMRSRCMHGSFGSGIDFAKAILIAKSIPLEKKFFALAEKHVNCADGEVRTLARLFFTQTERLFAFIRHPGVEPTNNSSERALRTAVQWHKTSFGNRSKNGEIATARLLTAAATCKMQNRNILEFLTETVRLHRVGLPTPSLLPQPAIKG